MKYWTLLLVSWIPMTPLWAQLAVEIVPDQQQFLKDEAMPIKVRITNRSGQTLDFGKEADWLNFSVESKDGFQVLRRKEIVVPGEFSLESAAVATRRVDLAPHFELSNPGRYSIGATLKMPQWNREVSSPPVIVEVVRGTKIWEQEFGVPAKEGLPEVRKYILQQATFRKDLTLYVRITDQEERQTYRVFAAGRLVSFNHPQAQVDRESKLHLLFQTGARTFIYNVVAPAGDLLLGQIYDYTGGPSMRLKVHGDGTIFVFGGTPRVKPEEAAALSTPSNTNDVKTIKP
jgi:hypothetical protein